MELLSKRTTGWPTAGGVGWRITLGLVIAALAGGCSQVQRPEQADQGEQVGIDEFMHEHLERQPMVTVAEAYRAILILADGDDHYDSFETREAALVERGMVRSAWGLQREACIDRGSVAYMVCRALGIGGGVNLRVFGGLGVGDRRYALKELIYMDMIPPSASYRYMTGSELADLIRNADEYMADHGMYEAESVDLTEVLETGVGGP